MKNPAFVGRGFQSELNPTGAKARNPKRLKDRNQS